MSAGLPSEALPLLMSVKAMVPPAAVAPYENTRALKVTLCP